MSRDMSVSDVPRHHIALAATNHAEVAASLLASAECRRPYSR